MDQSGEEQLLTEESAWREEAQAVIDDIKIGVKEVITSEKLPGCNSRIFINVTTLEGEKFCMELTYRGFRIVGSSYDAVEDTTGRFYETPYSLLNERSVKFREAFSTDLMSKLSALQTSSVSDDDDDADENNGAEK